MITKMNRIEVCPQSKNYIRLQDISTYLQKTVVLTEDASFWTHQGFDLDELKKSLEENIKVGSYKRGGSTITQQLAKNLFLTREKTLLRKLKEAIITSRIENVLSKKEILEKYLNVVQWGKSIYGIKSAAEFYFKKPASDLTVVESAFLAFLLPSPERYAAGFPRKELTDFSRKRISEIVDNMYRYKRLTDDEYLQAKGELKIFLMSSNSTHSTSDIEPSEDFSEIEEAPFN